MFRKIGKGIRRFMSDKIDACKEILTPAQNRLILGLIILGACIGIGGGLVLSAYIKVEN